ncbi:MAG: penicillin-binding protein 2, partial [Lachnospiraceae bacterium]|nr:penicillin-binding protein 2 [Lachnospiraceae bacterium]
MKLAVLVVIVLLAFAGLCARIIWINKTHGTEYEKKVLAQQKYDSVTIPFKRGDILDAKGTKLATNERQYNLVIDAKVLNNTPNAMEPTLSILGEAFEELDMAAVTAHITDNPTSAYYVPLKKLSYDKVSRYEELEKAAKDEGKKIAGVWFEKEYKRVYPNNNLASSVIGFTGSDNVGMFGLEEYYNDTLNGTAGREFGYLNEDSTLERTVKPAIDGYNIHSTIDANIQSIVEKYLNKFNEEYKNNAREGNGAENLGCIIMEVNTGNILAMADCPTYNLNDPRNPESLKGQMLITQHENAAGYMENDITDTAINDSVLASMDDESMMLNLNNLWKNYCISNTYEPGSTAKTFTVAAALEAGAITGNEVYDCGGYLEYGGQKIRCHNRNGDGAVSVENSIAWSCNVALMKIAQTLGAEEFSKFQNIFNFGLKTNVDLAGEARTASLVYPADEMKPVDLAVNSFGQGFNVTMIQLISGFCSLVNGGYYYEPHLVSKITNSSGACVKNIEPRLLKQTVSEETSALIRKYTKQVVVGQGGTGKTARPAGYMIGGKTGTAQTIPRDSGEYVVSFIGYAPADNPEIAIYVVVDRPNYIRQDDAKFATRIVRNILTEVLPYLNIPMTEPLSESEIEELNALQIDIKNSYINENQEAETASDEENPEGTKPQDETSDTVTEEGDAQST